MIVTVICMSIMKNTEMSDEHRVQNIGGMVMAKIGFMIIGGCYCVVLLYMLC